MTVEELRNALKGKDKNAHVYFVGDWEQIDEEGYLTDLHELQDVTTQNIVLDMGLDFEDRQQIILEFEK